MRRTEMQKRVEIRAATGSARDWERELPHGEWECGCTISSRTAEKSWWRRLLERIRKA
jgi:hypothetical protein